MIILLLDFSTWGKSQNFVVSGFRLPTQVCLHRCCKSWPNMTVNDLLELLTLQNSQPGAGEEKWA